VEMCRLLNLPPDMYDQLVSDPVVLCKLLW